MKWISVHKQKPPKYQLVEAKGKWTCPGIVYEDDAIYGWDQKKNGTIDVTHWRPIKGNKK